MITTRFAPSPTGMLHIGGARTALFNYLFATHHNGKFLLRIEDTDKIRSTPEATKCIIDGLNWLGIKHDDDIIFQSKNQKQHQNIAQKLINQEKAYYCYITAQELQEFRQKNPFKKFKSPWRDAKLPKAEKIKPVIRLKTPENVEWIHRGRRWYLFKKSKELLDMGATQTHIHTLPIQIF